MLRSPGFCVDGTLTLDGVPASLDFKVTDERTSSANMIPGSASSGPIDVASGPDGKIRLCDLYPGQFRIAALRGRGTGDADVFGATSVTVGKEDVHNVHVDAGAPVMVHGEVAWEGDPPDNSSAAQFILRAPPVTNDAMPGNSLRYPVPGTFSFPALRTVEHALQPGIGPPKAFPNAYVKEVTYGPVSILHQPFRAGDGTLRVTIGNDAGFIKATAPPGAHIVILPEGVSDEAALADAMVSGQADYDGTFTSWRLRPGQYRVLATSDILDRTPECIGGIVEARTRGQEVEVAPKATVSVTLSETVSLRATAAR